LKSTAYAMNLGDFIFGVGAFSMPIRSCFSVARRFSCHVAIEASVAACATTLMTNRCGGEGR
jgi:hypothetical protein